MSIDLPQARRTGGRFALYAVLSPVTAGLLWAVLTFLYWRTEASRPDADLGAVVAMWIMIVYGLLGLAALAIPLLIGLVAREPLTRLASAWVGSGICGLAGVFLLLCVVQADPRGADALLLYLSIVVLFAPVGVTAALGRRVMND